MPRKSWLARYEAPEWPQEADHEGEHLIVIGRWFFLVASASEPGSYHVVDMEGVEGEVGHCTCRSGETRKDCRHERAVRSFCGLPTPT